MTLCARLFPGARLKAGETQGGAGTPLPAAAFPMQEDFKHRLPVFNSPLSLLRPHSLTH